MSNFTTFNVNDMVFIENIGYGTLMECGNLKSIALKQPPTTLEKKQSIYFDPELFNSESENLSKQKSQCAVLVPNPKLEKQKQTQTVIQNQNIIAKQSEESSDKQKPAVAKEEPKANIVKIRLQGTNSLVYTPHTNMRKYVIVPVRPLFLPALGTLNIKIEIGKTIESFKKQIFDLLGLKHAHYFNIKLFTTSPQLAELNCPGKTIWQCGIRESSTLTMTAEHGFCFQPIPPHLNEYFSLANNNLTLLALPRKPKVVQNIIIALPCSVPTPPATEANSGVPVVLQSAEKSELPKIQDKKQQGQKVNQETAKNANQKKQTEKTEESKPKGPLIQQIASNSQQKVVQPPETLLIAGDKLMRSGKQYFEVRLDKLPHNSTHLKIGIENDNKSKRWLFSPLTQQKIYQQNGQTKSTQSYGMTFKQNDAVGVLTKIDKHKSMKVMFFKNNINLGVCFECRIEQIIFIFELGSEGQISLDTRVQPPIDSYRFR